MKHKVGFTCGAFDLLHAGHILMLEEAKSVCDYLIVGLQNDPSVDRPQKNKPIQSIVERQIQLNAVKFVDEIIVYNTEDDLLDLLSSLPIDVRVIGEDYLHKDFTGKQLCQDLHINVHFNARQHSFSSSSMRARVAAAENEIAKQQYKEPSTITISTIDLPDC